MEILKGIFTNVYNMSITAIFVIIFILMVRGVLRKSSKSISYYLWWIAGIRLILPVSVASKFSLFNLPFLRDEVYTGKQQIWEQISGMEPDVWAIKLPNIDPIVETVIIDGVKEELVHPVEPIVTIDKFDIYACVWLGIGIFILGFQLYSYLKLKRNLEMAVKLEDNVYECDRIQSPFVLGVIRPRIYIPFHLEEKEKRFILEHEKYHIRRRDYLIKIIAIIILSIHWFNPFVWLAYYLFSRDMEMSCDEYVIANMGDDKKKEYSNTLLDFATGHKKWSLGSLAFGETSVVERVQNILKFKKPGKIAVVSSIIICIFAIVVGITNGNQENVIKNVTRDTSNGAKYKYYLNEEIQSVVMYKEYYKYGELSEYEIIMHGSVGENGLEHEGELLFSVNPKYAENGLQYVDFMIGDEVQTVIRNEIAGDGYKAGVTTYLGEYESGWHSITPDKDTIVAAYSLDDGSGVSAYYPESYMDVNQKYTLIPGKAGLILYHIVFSELEEDALVKKYEKSSKIKELFEAQNPYTGDHIADGNLLRILGTSSLGGYGTKLWTEREPYGVTLHFEEVPENEVEFHEKILKKAALFLALTENAEFFGWTYPASAPSLPEKGRYYVEDIEQMLGINDLKAYAQSEETLQELYEGIENSDWAKVEAGYACQNITSGWRPFTHKEVITGRHPNAESDSTYLVYSYEKIKFEDITTYIFGSQYPKEKEMYVVNQP